jgi:hypothetical protein
MSDVEGAEQGRIGEGGVLIAWGAPLILLTVSEP